MSKRITISFSEYEKLTRCRLLVENSLANCTAIFLDRDETMSSYYYSINKELLHVFFPKTADMAEEKALKKIKSRQSEEKNALDEQA